MDDFDYTDKAYFFLDPNLKVLFFIKPENGQKQTGEYLFYLDVFTEKEAQDTCDMLQKVVDTAVIILNAKCGNLFKNGKSN